jgi:hypothetical protein
MKRQHWLILIVSLLLAGNVIWYFWMNWGLITVHSKNMSLEQVIRSIEKQGHVTIKTNLDLTKPVYMDVDKVVLAEALETLSTVTDSRWRLAYFVAPDKGAIGGAVANFTAGQKAEGWQAAYIPLMPLGEERAVPPDPRSDPWETKPAKEPTLQSYLQQAARSVAASFIYPENWNPPVNTPPKAAPIRKALPRLADAAGGKYQEIFLLEGNSRGGDGEGRDDDRGPRPAAFGGGRDRGGSFGRPQGFDREAMEERMQAELKKLPPAERAAIEQEQEERKKFFEGMRDLPPEQRAAKMEEFMSDPRNEERMEKAMSAREARRSPEQRVQRGQRMRERKQQAKDKAGQ